MKKTIPLGEAYRFVSTLERSDNRLWGCHFRVPARIANQLMDSKSRRVLCTLDGSEEHQCAILHHGDGAYVITVNKKWRDALGLAFGMEVRVGLKKDQSEYGLPVPEELAELFHQDEKGNALFHALTRGKQRALLHIVGSVKSSEKRLLRALAVVEHLKANSGKINYKRLNVMLRDPRR
jgi:hypothetical protein